MWNYVIPHFNQFLLDLQLEPKHRTDAEGKAERIAKSLFAKYYPNQLVFDPNCYLMVGSYGKGILVAFGPIADTWKIAAWFHYPNGWIVEPGDNGIEAVAPKDALNRYSDLMKALEKRKGTYVS